MYANYGIPKRIPLSYIKVEIDKLDTRGIYLWLKDYEANSISTFKPNGEFKLQIRIKTKGKLTKKTFKFPKSKTFRKAVEEVSNKRLDLVSEYNERGTLRPEKIIVEKKSKTFKENWDKYIKDISISAKTGTIKNFESTYKTWLIPWTNKTVITVEDAQELVHHMLNKGKSSNTIRNVLAPVKAFTFINWKEVKIPKLPEPRRYNWDIDDAKKLVNGMRNYKFSPHEMYKSDRSRGNLMQAIFEFLLRGRRVGEVLTLEHNDIDVERGVYTVRAVNAKSATTNQYPLDDKLLSKIPAGTGLIFNTTAVTVRRHFALLLKNLELPQIHVHDIRHITAIISLEAGVPIADVSRMLGHKDIATTERIYTNKGTQMAKRATDAFLNSINE